MTVERKAVKSKEFYALIIDQERATALSCVFSTCFQVEPILHKNLQEFGVSKCFNELLTEISEKEHKLGWCENPLCKHKHKEDEDKDGGTT